MTDTTLNKEIPIVTGSTEAMAGVSVVSDDSRLIYEWDRADRMGAIDVGRFSTISDGLEWLHLVGQRSLVMNVRYYILYGARGMISVECAGHSEQISEQLRYGVRRDHGLNTRESFYCFEIGKPVVCLVDAELTDAVVEESPISEMIAHARVPDSCGKIVGREGKRLYIDIPVAYHGKNILKFSCDLCVDDPALLLVDELEAFCRFANMLGHVLIGMQDEACRLRRKEELLKVGRLATLTEIGRYIAMSLPPFFRCETADFLRLTEEEHSLEPISDTEPGSVGADIVRNESLRELAMAASRRSDASMFCDLRNRVFREQEWEMSGLDRSSLGDHWDDPLQTRSAMLIPVEARFSERTLGILVFRNKRAPGKNREDLACFSELDRRMAMWHANECLGRRIEFVLEAAQRAARLERSDR